jgi:hypothetical protein
MVFTGLINICLFLFKVCINIAFFCKSINGNYRFFSSFAFLTQEEHLLISNFFFAIMLYKV